MRNKRILVLSCYFVFFAEDFLAVFFAADFALGFMFSACTELACRELAEPAECALCSAFFGESMCAKRDLIRAALFLWKMCILAALSKALTALLTVFAVGDATAFLIVSLTDSSIFARSIVLFLSCRNFFFADFITGISLFYHVILKSAIYERYLQEKSQSSSPPANQHLVCRIYYYGNSYPVPIFRPY